MEKLFDVGDLYLQALGQGAPTLGIALLAFLAASWLLGPGSGLTRRWPRLARGLAAGVVVLAVLQGLRFGWELRWLGDDAYISFRYADNFANGLGLVFNPGEWVEGYTNFLWTLLLGIGIRLGASPVTASVGMGLFSFAAAIGLTCWLGAREGRRGGQGLGPAPFILAFSYTLASFATSGLETMFAALLVVAALALLEGHRPLLAGLCALGAGMSHPDHMLFAAAMGLALLSVPGRRREFLGFAGIGAAVYLPYTAWRLWAYGELVPNTAIAKSASESWFDQGALYCWVSFLGAGIWALLPLGVVGLWRGRGTVLARAVALGVPVYVLYVAKVGGDFMQGRLFVTVVLLLVLCAERGFHALVQDGRRWASVALGALSLAAALPVSLVPAREFVHQVSDERTFYLLQSLDPLVLESPYKAQGDALYDTFTSRGILPRVAVRCVGMVAYYSQLSVFDLYGLTSKSVARMPLAARGRPGHEKQGTAGHVLEDGAVLSAIPVVPPPYERFTEVRVGDTRYFLARHEQAVVDALHAVNRPPDPVETATAMVALWPTLDRERVDCDLAFLDGYYLVPDGPPGVEAIVRAAADALPGGRGRVLDEPTGPPLWRESFDLPARWTRKGRAFAGAGRNRQVAGQSHVFGVLGPHVNSFVPTLGDAAEGSLSTQEFRLDGDTLSLWVGGGRDMKHLRVELLVDGKVRRKATGCNSEVLTRRTWDISDLRGQQAQLRLIDAAKGSFGHLLVDEIAQYAD